MELSLIGFSNGLFFIMSEEGRSDEGSAILMGINPPLLS